VCLSKYEFGRRLARTFGFREDLVVPSDLSQAGFRAPRPRRTCLEGTKARGILGMDLPSVDLGLARLESLAGTGYLRRLRAMAVK
jgi:dTDP-4-dehydrorhamnose reductase